MELDPVQAALRALAGGDRRAGAGGERREAGRRLEDASRWLIQHCCSRGRPASRRPPPSTSASGVRPNSPASAPSTRRPAPGPSPACRNRSRAPGCRARAARRRSSGAPSEYTEAGPPESTSAAGLALADPVELGRRAAGARRTRRTRGSGGRSAASTGRRSRGPVPPRDYSAVSGAGGARASRPSCGDRVGGSSLTATSSLAAVGVAGTAGRVSHRVTATPAATAARPFEPMPTDCSRWSFLPSVWSAGATITSARWKSRMSS